MFDSVRKIKCKKQAHGYFINYNTHQSKNNITRQKEKGLFISTPGSNMIRVFFVAVAEVGQPRFLFGLVRDAASVYGQNALE